MFLSNLTIRRKFTFLLVLQATFLLLVAFLGWQGIEKDQNGLERAGKDLAKSQAVERILEQARAFHSPSPFVDDVTLVLLDRVGC